jgi:hypothetical protein
MSKLHGLAPVNSHESSRRKKMKRGLFFVLGLIVGALGTVLLAALILVFVVTRPMPKTPETTAAAGDIVVTVDENYLTRMVTDSMQEQEGIKEVIVNVQPQAVMEFTFVAQIEVVGLELNPSIKGTGFLQASNQRLEFTLQKIELAGITVPRSSLPAALLEPIEKIEADFSQQINDSLTQSNLTPVGVASDDQSIVVTFKGK